VVVGDLRGADEGEGLYGAALVMGTKKHVAKTVWREIFGKKVGDESP